MTNEALAQILSRIAYGDIDNAEELIVLNAHVITQPEADAIMAVARVIDPPFAGAAAYIRDTIRDNTELNV